MEKAPQAQMTPGVLIDEIFLVQYRRGERIESQVVVENSGRWEAVRTDPYMICRVFGESSVFCVVRVSRRCSCTGWRG